MSVDRCRAGWWRWRHDPAAHSPSGVAGSALCECGLSRAPWSSCELSGCGSWHHAQSSSSSRRVSPAFGQGLRSSHRRGHVAQEHASAARESTARRLAATARSGAQSSEQPDLVVHPVVPVRRETGCRAAVGRSTRRPSAEAARHVAVAPTAARRRHAQSRRATRSRFRCPARLQCRRPRARREDSRRKPHGLARLGRYSEAIAVATAPAPFGFHQGSSSVGGPARLANRSPLRPLADRHPSRSVVEPRDIDSTLHSTRVSRGAVTSSTVAT